MVGVAEEELLRVLQGASNKMGCSFALRVPSPSPKTFKQKCKVSSKIL